MSVFQITNFKATILSHKCLNHIPKVKIKGNFSNKQFFLKSAENRKETEVIVSIRG